eukprot:5312365-Amphidinium_carterae.1
MRNAAATSALEAGPQGRGQLCLLSKTLNVLAHAWPPWLGECPATAQAQRELLEGRATERRTEKARASRAAWKTFVREAW